MLGLFLRRENRTLRHVCDGTCGFKIRMGLAMLCLFRRRENPTFRHVCDGTCGFR